MKLAKLFGAAALFASMVATAHAANTTVTVKVKNSAVAGAECNTVIELKQAQHDAFPPLLS